MDNIDHIKDKLIEAQEQVIKLFDNWVMCVKEERLEDAKQIKELANIKRREIYSLNEELKKLKNSKIVRYIKI